MYVIVYSWIKMRFMVWFSFLGRTLKLPNFPWKFSNGEIGEIRETSKPLKNTEPLRSVS